MNVMRLISAKDWNAGVSIENQFGRRSLRELKPFLKL